MSAGREEARRALESAPADLQYAVLFSPRKQRVALSALLAIYSELRGILRACRDAAIARTKLDWWQKELELLAQHQPQHPLCQLLDTSLQGRSLPTQTLFDITASVSTDIGAVAFQNFAEVELYCRQRGGALTELAAQIGGSQNNVSLQAARMLGQSWQLADIVLHGSEYAMLGRNYFAADDLQRYAVELPLPAAHKSAPGLPALLQDYTGRTQALRANAMALPGVNCGSLACGLVLAGLAGAKLRRFAARKYAAPDQPLELRGLTQLWIAWRNARRAH